MEREVKGMRELRDKMKGLKEVAQGAAMRNAGNFAMTPVVKQMQATAPRGTRGHKTYKGRVVAPGFLSRMIAKRSWVSKDRTVMRTSVGFRREAFYGNFLNPASKRKQKKNDFHVKAMDDNVDIVLGRFASQLAKAVYRAARKGKNLK